MPPKKKKSQPKTKKKTVARKTATGPKQTEAKSPAVEEPIGPAPKGKVFFRCTSEIKDLARSLKGQYHELFKKESWSMADTQGELVAITYRDKDDAKEASVEITRFGNFLSAHFPDSVKGYGSERQEHHNRLIKVFAEQDNSQSEQKPVEKSGRSTEAPMVVLLAASETVFSFAGIYVPAELTPFIDEITNLVSDIYAGEVKFANLLAEFARSFARINPQTFRIISSTDNGLREKLQAGHEGLVKLVGLLERNLPKPGPTEVKIIKVKNGEYSALVDGVEKKGADIRTLITLALLRKQETFTVEQFMNLYAGASDDLAIYKCRNCINLA
ncbi:MAG: hypothetical protein WCK17_13980, partial [Verrucomicrobiota bacterium]